MSLAEIRCIHDPLALAVPASLAPRLLFVVRTLRAASRPPAASAFPALLSADPARTEVRYLLALVVQIYLATGLGTARQASLI